MSKVTKHVLAVVVLTVGVGVLVVDRSDRPAAAETPLSDSASVQARADALYESFNGSTRERDAGAVLQAYALNGGMDGCMEAAGFPGWDWSMPRAKNPVNHGLETTTFFAPPLTLRHTDALLEAAPAIRADAKARTVTLNEDEDAAVGRCIETVPPTSDDSGVSSPATATQLREVWWDMLDGLDTEYGDGAKYHSCIAERDIPGLGAIRSPTEATERLTELHPSTADLPVSATDPAVRSAEWLRLVEAESAWTQVDWLCRSATYNEHLADVAAALDEFEEQHAQQIVAARSGWNEISSAATKLGYDGTYGVISASAR